jgi:hypothetical protein
MSSCEKCWWGGFSLDEVVFIVALLFAGWVVLVVWCCGMAGLSVGSNFIVIIVAGK